MRGWPERAWGKLRRLARGPSDQIEWHPLVDHCADVAACVEALLIQPTIANRLGLDPNDQMRIARIGALAFLHDLGKANRGFQNKKYRRPDDSYPRGVDPAGHVRELAPLFDSDHLASRLIELVPFETMASWGPEAAICGLLSASVSHHGTPFDPWSSDPECRYRFRQLWEPAADGYDPFVAISELGSALRRWFAAAFENGGTPLPNSPAFQHAFAGLVMLADWLGSDTKFFPYSRSDDDRMAFAREQAPRALSAVDIVVRSKRVYVGAQSPRFVDVFPAIRSPNAMQVGTGRLDVGRLVALEAETGSGKTEAALWRFKQLFEARAVDGLYFALPTRIAATQIHGRVSRAVEHIFAEEDRPSVVLAVPGYVRVDDVEGRILPGFQVLWPDDPDDAEAHKRWAAENPKRFLAAQIAVGTIDQALLSNLMVRHAHLRSTALLRHLLVIDEVHASDAYMTRLLASVLTVHVGAGGHALLMSATLGAAARRQLLLGRRALPPSPAEAAAVAYPSLSWADGPEEVIVPLEAMGQSKTVAMRCVGEIDAPEAIAHRALDAARAGAKVLVVRNTVRAAVAVQQALEAAVAEAPDPSADAALLFRCEGVATLHHGRFAGEDRKLLDRAVEVRFGRDRVDGGAVVVGTQTLEQSLDIDADLLITDLCPIDVLLQRLGRLHRHLRPNRPPDCERAQCFVLTFAERDLSRLLGRSCHGLGPSRDFRGVYPDLRVIEATWRLLLAHPQFDIPAINRMLVEGATHPAELDAVAAELGPAWQAHGDALAGKESADRSIAALHTIDRDQPFQEVRFPGLDERVQTRLGADSRLIDFGAEGAAPPVGPFGRPVRVLTLPEHLCRGIPANAVVTITEQSADGFQFSFGDKLFVYGPHGVERHRESNR
ncbi:CRISPR-associated endonuclease/helicase Cas3 [uncultured Defluviicoccus sp.]|uniref:CRISPR-associated endonuclease/helicase Cas3 n=1 Tax=metagenome TaxID=256318 RepID=A0A380TLV0_9ZZZZ|nr:CRISPR-associated endonuclease/helicase Cas3 [uncultured Defluviicoccus sp.]